MKRFDAILNPLPLGHDLLWRLRALAVTRGRCLLRDPTRRRRVVLFHVGRSGSTVLGSLLKQHRRVLWDSEIYEELFQALEARRRPLEEAARRIDPAAYLAKRLAWSGDLVYGFEVKFFHLRLFGTPLSRYIDRLEDLGFRHFILLKRKNTLRAVVSSLIAAETRRWHRPIRSRARQVQIDLWPEQIRIDRERKPLRAFLEDYRSRFLEVERILGEKRVLRLVYEDDVCPDPREAYHRVCGFLGLTPEPVELRYGRTNPFPLHEMVRDLDRVQEALRGTRFEWMTGDHA